MTPVAADWKVLKETVAGEVVLPGMPDFEVVSRPALARFESTRPMAVVRCRTPADVSATIAFARAARLKTAVRSGGHCFAGRSSTEGIVIDVTPMCSVSVADGLATVGAGARLGDLNDRLEEHGLTLPAGCTPSVGIAGLTLGGGIGLLGRKHGLTSDHMVAAQVVLANGRVVECDAQHDEDLFWALRGAGGGNFGVVTSFVFRTLTAPAATGFHLVWPITEATAVIDAWQKWAPSAPDALDATLRLTAPGAESGPPVVNLLGAMLGSEADTALLLDDLTARAGAEPASESRWHMPYRALKRSLVGLGSIEANEHAAPDDARSQGHFFSKSEFFRQRLPTDAIARLVDNLGRGVAPSYSREVDLTPWGGAYNRVGANASAFVHRNELFMVEHEILLNADATAVAGEAARTWLRRSWALVHPWGSGGVYPNFPDPDLQDWGFAYYRENYERLLTIKAKYDPSDFFHFPQSLERRAP